ncbi:serine/threonine-protein kinase [Paenarthrobacter aurescens]|uniref:serine/threonine-protein kinase n=1 Tax=Paenarthrobacter aurescens TaxID=43663 RepID=UPI0021BE6C79|nr:serine/threonine-protein kinase [Paenarthrobacter aurescens]MCT9871770.1 serine/threonine protein kinase [Paenarthrobacter aurescens]
METLDTPAAVTPSIPGYETSRILGQGSSSTVWLATRNKDGARFAVKCAVGAAGGGGAFTGTPALEVASREARLLSGFKHQHLVSVYEVLLLGGTGSESLGIVMDYAAGGSLGNLLASRRSLRVGEAVTILTPIAQALEYLHGRGTVHGDVSPGNVLFTAEGMPLLADFGVAAVVGGDQQELDVGTPGFMDPAGPGPGRGEVAHNGLQPQRDVYSLAAVGWYCLTGSAPQPAELRPPLSLVVPDVPKSLVAALEAGLDPDPQVRPSARELGTAIFRSAAPEPLDLSGAVHSSVIPELLTRRQALGRAPGRTARWMRSWRKFLPPKQMSALRPQGGLRRRRGRRLKGGAALLAASVILLGIVGWSVWQHNPLFAVRQPEAVEVSTATPGPGVGPTDSPDLPEGLAQGLRSEDPAVALSALSSLRDIALAEGRLELLASVNAPGSPAEAADRQLADHLREAGTVFAGFHMTLSDVATKGSSEADNVLVGVTAMASNYEERHPTGAVVRTQAAGTPQELRLRLVRSEGRWWISEILAPGTAG